MTTYKTIAAESLSISEARPINVNGEPLLLCRVSSDVYRCVRNECSHEGQPFGAATLDGNVLTCPHHLATFNVDNGSALKMPAVSPLELFSVAPDENGILEIVLEDDE